ncbi:MAG: hypothetical protein ACRELV_13505 [Longimicrobiales bacterium]
MVNLTDALTKNLALKTAAFALAVLLWGVLQADAPGSATFERVPIQVLVDDPDWTLAGPPDPDSASVVFVAATRELFGDVRGGAARIVVPIDNVDDEVEFVALTAPMVRVGGLVEPEPVARIEPDEVRLRFERVVDQLLPVAIRVRGELPPGTRLSGPIRAEPDRVRVSGGSSRVEALDSIPLMPFNIAGFERTDTILVNIDTTAIGRLLVSPREIQVIVPAVTVSDSLLAADSLLVADSLDEDGRPVRRQLEQ